MDIIELFKKSIRWRYHLKPLQFSYGKEFRLKAKFLKQSLYYSDEQLRDYVWHRLEKLIHYAYNNTEYYNKIFTKLGATAADIKSFDDFRKLPTTNRKIVREHLQEMTPQNFEATKPIQTVTSGTTGYPLTLYRSYSHEILRKAIVWRHFNQLGYKYKQRRVSLGRPIEFPNKEIYHIYDVLENNLQLNSFHLNPQDFLKLYQAAYKFQPKMIFGHPAALYTFCLQSEKMNLPPLRTSIIYCVAEKLYPHHIEMFEQYFGGKVYDYYGNRENTLAVTQFPCGNYHINSEFGYVEFETEGQPTKNGEVGSIISTPLENYSTPLLRYDTADLGRPMGKCSNCNIVHPTMEILGGRSKDVLVTDEGYVNCHLDTYLARKGFTGADYLQVHQKELKKITLRILPNENYDKERDESNLCKLTEDCLGNNFVVDIEYLSTPPFTEAGKMPYVINDLLTDKQS